MTDKPSQKTQQWLASITPRPEIIAVSGTVWGVRHNGAMVCAPTIDEAVNALQAAQQPEPSQGTPPLQVGDEVYIYRGVIDSFAWDGQANVRLHNTLQSFPVKELTLVAAQQPTASEPPNSIQQLPHHPDDCRDPKGHCILDSASQPRRRPAPSEHGRPTGHTEEIVQLNDTQWEYVCSCGWRGGQLFDHWKDVRKAAQQPTTSEQEMGGLREAAEWMKAQSQRTDIGPSRREAFELSWRKLEAALNE